MSADTPDGPLSFGYKCAWLAIRSSSPDAVARALDLARVSPSSWARGIDAAYAGRVFISPPLGEWILAVSTGLPEFGDERHPDEVTPLLNWLARQFPEVQYFATHRVVEAHAWARLVDGTLVRRFGYVGDQGFVAWDEGEPSAQEEELGVAFTRESLAEGASPDEEAVMVMANLWSLDPTRLEERGFAPALGLTGSLPG